MQKIESQAAEEFTEEEIFMNENIHHPDYEEYSQSCKKFEEFEQPHHSQAHLDEYNDRTQNYTPTHNSAMALKPRNEGKN